MEYSEKGDSFVMDEMDTCAAGIGMALLGTGVAETGRGMPAIIHSAIVGSSRDPSGT